MLATATMERSVLALNVGVGSVSEGNSCSERTACRVVASATAALRKWSWWSCSSRGGHVMRLLVLGEVAGLKTEFCGERAQFLPLLSCPVRMEVT